jgi:hypothetical protein
MQGCYCCPEVDRRGDILGHPGAMAAECEAGKKLV